MESSTLPKLLFFLGNILSYQPLMKVREAANQHLLLPFIDSSSSLSKADEEISLVVLL
jgi:hypothetical protein